MVEIVVFLNALAAFISLLQVISPFPSLRQALKTGDLSGISHSTLVAINFNSLLWTVRGYTIRNSGIFYPNLVYLAVSGVSIAFYHFVSKSRPMFLIRHILVLTLAGVIFSQLSKEILGLSCLVVNLAMFVAPFEQLLPVLKEKNQNLIDFNMTVAALASSVCWFLFGLGIQDLVVIVINFVGVVLSTVQLVVKFWAQGILPDSLVLPIKALAKIE